MEGPARRIEDYALLGDLRTAALVSRSGAIEWLCLPRFDSPACFASLLGTPDNGHWLIAPRETPKSVTRRYLDDTLVLETRFETDSGAVRLIDFMPFHEPDDEYCVTLVRIVEGLRGSVPMHLDVRFRFDYGRIVPWVTRADGGLRAIAGPDALRLTTPLPLEGQDFSSVADFTISAGQRLPAVLLWYRSYEEEPQTGDPEALLSDTVERWRKWSGRCIAPAESRDVVVRSAITLKALIHQRTGGIVAAPTTSLPEHLGGVRNWDYRYCWLRDATFTLYALMLTGYTDEARSWRSWLVRAAAGEPSKLQIMYGVAGEHRLDEYELPWLSGFCGSSPVRVGNAAHVQLQLDVYGEIMDALHCARGYGIEANDDAWRIQEALLDFLETGWLEPDAGIWEQRGPLRHYVHSALMTWVAADRAVKAVERFGIKGPPERWRRLRAAARERILSEGFNTERNAFVQTFGGKELDAALLMLPLVGFLPPDDPRVIGTAEAIQRELMVDGFVKRYRTSRVDDGLPPGEGTFLPCTLWLADNLALLGRRGAAREVYDRVLAVRNDVGLLAEEYDPVGRQLLGNFPQAFSHVGLINTACNLVTRHGPAERRAEAGTGRPAHMTESPPGDPGDRAAPKD